MMTLLGRSAINELMLKRAARPVKLMQTITNLNFPISMPTIYL
jgi:hypothetical protein